MNDAVTLDASIDVLPTYLHSQATQHETVAECVSIFRIEIPFGRKKTDYPCTANG
jgi:hypothetical protein